MQLLFSFNRQPPLLEHSEVQNIHLAIGVLTLGPCSSNSATLLRAMRRHGKISTLSSIVPATFFSCRNPARYRKQAVCWLPCDAQTSTGAQPCLESLPPSQISLRSGDPLCNCVTACIDDLLCTCICRLCRGTSVQRSNRGSSFNHLVVMFVIIGGHARTHSASTSSINTLARSSHCKRGQRNMTTHVRNHKASLTWTESLSVHQPGKTLYTVQPFHCQDLGRPSFTFCFWAGVRLEGKSTCKQNF